MYGIEPDEDEHEGSPRELTEDGVLSGQGAELVGDGMVEVHYVL